MPGHWDGQGVYLTGATGFIGTELARRLRKAGAEVTALTRDASRAKHLSEMGCQLVEGNVLDPESLAIPEDTDTVIHGAAWVAYGVPSKKAELFRRTNVEGTRHVLEAAKGTEATTFCHISSVAAIGPTPAGLYTEERVEKGRFPGYRSLYEETKHKAHMLVLEEHGHLEPVLPMPGVVLGRRSDTGQLLEAYADQSLWRITGDNPSPFVHVEDTVEGILAAANKGRGPYILVDRNLVFDELLSLFHEASGVPTPTRRLPLGLLKAGASIMQIPYHLVGKVPPLSRELVDHLELPFTYSSQRAVEGLGWQPDLVSHLEEDFLALAQGG